MRVIDLIGNNFILACEELAEKVTIANYTPDLIIGVLTGGGKVGQIIHDKLDISKNIFYTEVKIQRKNKKNIPLRKILKKTPKILTNYLRIFESKFLLLKSKLKEPSRFGVIDFSEEVVILLKQGNKNILLVDDAIDSGATLKTISDYINKNYPNNIIKIAVITITNKKPMIGADYYLFHNHTLVRFPWSNDA
ncbi:hypothetical protein D0T84_14500 [Dysgonomonas sp. 521]|uniref:phosphoribosyltransferase n=1 Tax=Dysgonomonas sp. 521 TaxID=2302932 RepID=UPI0013D25CF8|nr:phosphoribosyltransferase family protein [Dysgonomonas sp. 521]NDV96113.1 hypothetical protein [Dysgonomonas sp. 521]